MDWPPISTAPIDGTRILLYEKDNNYPELSYDIGYRSTNNEYWVSALDNPTHWAPLNPPEN